MDNTAVRLVLWAGTVAAVSVYSSTVAQARPQTPARESDAPEQAAGLNGLQTGRRAGGRIALDSTGIGDCPLRRRWDEGSARIVGGGPRRGALAPPPGTIDASVLAAEIAARLGPWRTVASASRAGRHVATGDVAADRLVLRWMIAKTGRVFGAQAVATTPTDDGVLYCVKRQMTGWTFPRPSGGPLPIERDFTFRPVPMHAK